MHLVAGPLLKYSLLSKFLVLFFGQRSERLPVKGHRAFKDVMFILMQLNRVRDLK